MKLWLRALLTAVAVVACLTIAGPAFPIPIPNADQAAQRATQLLLPTGTDSVLLWVWGPVPAGVRIQGTKELVFTAPASGWVVYIDDLPTANLFHPVRYAFVDSLTGATSVFPASSPPLNYADYTHLPTLMEQRLAAVPNRIPPWGKPLPISPTDDNPRWAVLMSGGYNISYNWSRYWNDLSSMYVTLNHVYDYPDDHIIVLCSDGLDPAPDQPYGVNSPPDLDGDGDDDIMYPCLLANVDAVFAQLAQTLAQGDQLFIYTTDHGDTYGGWNTLENLWNLEELTDAHFAQLLEALPAGVEIACALQPCYSGGFLDDIIRAPGPIAASTAAAYNQFSWTMPSCDYDAFSYYWTAAIKGEDAFGAPADADYDGNGIITMNEAYQYVVLHDPTYEDQQFGEYPQGVGSDMSLWPRGSGASLVVTDQFINDIAGNNNNHADPGETVNLTLSLSNTGEASAGGISATLASTNPYLNIVSNGSNWPPLGHFQTAPGSPPYHLIISNTCPQGEIITCSVHVTAAGGYSSDDTIHFTVGASAYGPVGPDAYGYCAYDNVDVPGGLVFNWVEVAPQAGGPGTALTELTGFDNKSTLISLPFTFRYYGQSYTQATVCTNGWVAMGNALSDSDGSNSPIPNPDGPAAMLAPFWDNIRIVGGAQVATWYDASTGRFVIEYLRVRLNWLYADQETFEIILFDPALYPTSTGDGRILFQYVQLMEPFYFTAGIENQDETTGLQCVYNDEYDSHSAIIQPGRAILFTTALDPANVTVDLTPYGTPIQIPANGGNFSFNVALHNAANAYSTFTCWCDLTYPDSSSYGPVLGPFNLTLPAGANLSRNRSQTVPGSAPPGTYHYNAYVGSYPVSVWAQDSFTFVKLGSGSRDSGFSDWLNAGEDFLTEPEVCGYQPSAFSVMGVSPNPFNPTTALRYQLPAVSRVNLRVYDVSGRLVATLVDAEQQVGEHRVTFDGSKLASGLYFAVLQAGEIRSVQKLVLLK